MLIHEEIQRSLEYNRRYRNKAKYNIWRHLVYWYPNTWGKNLFKCFWYNLFAIWENTRLFLIITAYARINSNRIRDLNIKHEAIQVAEETMNEIFYNLDVEEGFAIRIQNFMQ